MRFKLIVDLVTEKVELQSEEDKGDLIVPFIFTVRDNRLSFYSQESNKEIFLNNVIQSVDDKFSLLKDKILKLKNNESDKSESKSE